MCQVPLALLENQDEIALPPSPSTPECAVLIDYYDFYLIQVKSVMLPDRSHKGY